MRLLRAVTAADAEISRLRVGHVTAFFRLQTVMAVGVDAYCCYTEFVVDHCWMKAKVSQW